MADYRRIFRLFTRGRRARRREIDLEIQAHLDMRVDDLVRRGWDPAEARAEAERRFGDLDRARAELAVGASRRDRRLGLVHALDRVRADTGLALRRARRAPGFTLLALVTLALGIGLTTSVFSAVDRVLLRALPYPEPDDLVALYSVSAEAGPIPQVSSESWLDWDEHGRTLAASAIHMALRPVVSVGAGAVRVDGQLVSPDFFRVLRPRFVRGRGPTDDEARADATVAVVTEAFWRDVMGSPESLPHSLEIGHSTVEVVGVVEGRQAYPAGTTVWFVGRFRRTGVGMAHNWINWRAVARLAPGVDLRQVDSDLDGVAGGIRETAPEALYAAGVDPVPLQEHLTGGVRRELLLLLGAVGAVLLLASLNLAGLSLARTLDRSDELAVRVALGAGRGRVVGQLLTEHLVLSLVGGLWGLGVARLALEWAEGRAAGLLAGAEGLALDGRAVLAALALSCLAGLGAGIVPALRARSSAPAAAVGQRGGGRAGHRLGGWLVGAEVAMAVLLLAGGGLLVRSFLELTARDLGYEPHDVVVAEIALDAPRYATDLSLPPGDPALGDAGAAARRTFWEQLVDGVRAHPAVSSAGIANRMPTGTTGTGFIEVEGLADPDLGAGYEVVGRDYFRTMGIPIVSGRGFGVTDGPETERVVLVNEAMAEELWPGESPLGRRLRALSMEGGFDGERAPWVTVVGVVGDVLHAGFEDEASSTMYALAEQVPYWMGSMYLVARVDGEPGPAVASIRRLARGLDPSLAVETSLLEDRVGAIMHERVFVTSLVTAFAGVALLLAAVGLYGLLAFQVARRAREIGIRAALGAERGRIVRHVLGRSLRVVVLGTAVGLLASLWAARALSTLLWGVEPGDPAALVTASALVLATGLVASWVPAWRAARVDPLEALRTE